MRPRPDLSVILGCNACTGKHPLLLIRSLGRLHDRMWWVLAVGIVTMCASGYAALTTVYEAVKLD